MNTICEIFIAIKNKIYKLENYFVNCNYQNLNNFKLTTI